MEWAPKGGIGIFSNSTAENFQDGSKGQKGINKVDPNVFFFK